MQNWFECKVRYTKIDEQTGKEKTVTEPYLVDAISFTEAEARITEEIEKIVSGEFAITNINKSKIHDVFFFEDGDYWYKCKVSIVDMDEKTGKEKKTPNIMLVPAATVKEAYERIEQSLASFVAPWEINSIIQSSIVDLFPFFKDENAEVEIPENLKKLTDLLVNAKKEKPKPGKKTIDDYPDDLQDELLDDYQDDFQDDEFGEEYADEDEFSEDQGFSIDDNPEFRDLY